MKISNEQIRDLLGILLDAQPDISGLRDDVARDLGGTGNPKIFKALLEFCKHPDEYAIRDGIVGAAGESLAELSLCIQFEPKELDGIHQDALSELLPGLSSEDYWAIYQYALNPGFSDNRFLHYYFNKFAEQALKKVDQNSDGAQTNRWANEALDAFFKIVKSSNNEMTANQYFEALALLVLTNKLQNNMSSVLQILQYKLQQEKPTTKFSHWSRLLIKAFLLAEESVGQNRQNKEALLTHAEKLKNWMLHNNVKDKFYLDIFQLYIHDELNAAHHCTAQQECSNFSNNKFNNAWLINMGHIIDKEILRQIN